jgi:hypothetical protein
MREGMNETTVGIKQETGMNWGGDQNPLVARNVCAGMYLPREGDAHTEQ